MSNMHPNIQQLMWFLSNFNHKQHDVVFYGPNWKQLLGIHCAKAFEIPVKSSKICKPYSFGLLLNVFWIMKIMQDGKFFFNQHHNLINDWSKIRKEMFFKKKYQELSLLAPLLILNHSMIGHLLPSIFALFAIKKCKKTQFTSKPCTLWVRILHWLCVTSV